MRAQASCWARSCSGEMTVVLFCKAGLQTPGQARKKMILSSIFYHVSPLFARVGTCFPDSCANRQRKRTRAAKRCGRVLGLGFFVQGGRRGLQHTRRPIQTIRNHLKKPDFLRKILPASYKILENSTSSTSTSTSSTSAAITCRCFFHSAYTVAMNSRTKALIQK